MAHYTADRMTSGATQANHTGLNIGIANFTLNETGSGSTTVALMPLPGGARVIDVTYTQNHDAIGTGAEAVTIYATIGGNSAATYLETATQATVVRPNRNGLGTRLTGSANLILQFNHLVGTGTASTVVKVICQYMVQDDAD